MNKLFKLILFSITVLQFFGCVLDPPPKGECDEDKICLNGGVLDKGTCDCNCQSGYRGELCEIYDTSGKLNAFVDIDSNIQFNYNPPGFDFYVFDHATDTLWIDGYNNAQSTYCFLRLYVADHTTIKSGSKFPIKAGNAVGTCWASFMDPSIDAFPFSVQQTLGDTLTIQSYIPGGHIYGTFNFHAKEGTSTAHVTGSFNN